MHNYRKTIDKLVHHVEFKKKNLAEKERELEALRNDLVDHEHVRSIFKEAAQLAQNNLSEHIGKIVSKSLEIVFPEKEVEFVVEFVDRRNTTECDLYVTDGKYRYDLLDERGHGMADIVSMSLRVAFVSLSKVDNLIIFDEPFRNLDATKHHLASQLIRSLSRELNMQFIISTHITSLVSYADKHIHVNFKDGVSTIEYKKVN